MLLRELVKINEAGLVADAVNFDMIADEKKNQRLCEGFVFNYDHNQPKSSTVGVLDALRRSYHSPNEPNVHLLVQDYGKGKSHFGLVIANFFKQSHESLEVKGILHQLEIATSSNSGRAIFEGLKNYKQRSKKHLVICLSGEQGDIKKLFLRSLRQALEAEGIIDSIAQHICAKPIQYLEGLDSEKLAVAEKYLASIGNPDGDVKSLIRLLKEDNYQLISTVVDISRELTNGFSINFEADLNIEEILEELINNYCSGENRCFEGILILIDELNAYLQSWANNPAAAGGMALQNITNVCEKYKGKIALMSFTQIRPSNASAIPRRSQEIKSYQKLTSRLELSPSTYEPISSLELVLSNLIIRQRETLWQQFIRQWDNTLLAEGRDAYDKRIPIYRERNWNFSEFHRYLTLNCFPLHPLTTYLLCNLDFTQGRTAIQFIKEDVKNFIQNESIESNGKPNYIYPVKLVDAFEDNFSNYPIYKDYQKAYTSVSASAIPEEITILKGIFLFYASGNKLIKLDRESHEDILSILTGLSTLKVKKSLEQLSQTRRVIYQLPNNTYGFYSGVSIVDLEEQINNEVNSERLSGHQYSVKEVVDYCRTYLSAYLNSKTIYASHFVAQNQLLRDDWQFEHQIYTISEIQKIINSSKLPQNIEEKGLLGYVIAETESELQDFRIGINNLLQTSPIRYQIAIAISRQETTETANALHFLKKLREKSTGEKQALGQAYSQLVEQYQQKVEQRLKEVFKSCTYHCSVIEKIPNSERNKPDRIISELLKELYPFVPPVNSNDKMALKSRSGLQIISFASKQLLADKLAPQILPNKSHQNVLDPIFVTQWGLLKKTSQKYSVKVPTQERVRAAWDKISEMTDLKGKQERSIDLSKIWQELSASPYGYNEFTFTILFAAWLAYHSSEVSLKGTVGIPKGRELLSEKIQPVREWINTNILDNPKKFVSDWILRCQPKLIRRLPSSCPEIPSSVNYDEAQQYLQEIENFLQSDNLDPLKVKEIKNKQRQLNNGIEKINDWFKPIKEANEIFNSVEIEQLSLLYRSLLETQEPSQLPSKEGVTNVCSTQQQQEQYSQTLQSVRNKIEELVGEYPKRAKSLKTSEQHGAYKVEVQNAIEQLQKIDDLPNRFITILESSKEDAKASVEALQEQKKINICLAQIENLSRRLGSNATQNEYTEIVSDIEQLVEGVPEAKSQQTYQQIIHQIEQQQKALNSLLKQWQKHYVEINSSAQANQLKEQIIRQENRFTESDSKQKIETLLKNLKTKIDKLISQERVREKQKTSQKWFNTLANKQKEFQSLNDNQPKLKIANVILELIQSKKNIYFDFLNKEQQQLVEQSEEQCQKIINQDQENKIIAIFQKFTDEQKMNLYKKLSQYLPE